MILNDFRLANYQKTRGEGESFIADLLYKDRFVARFIDHSDSQLPQIVMAEGGWGYGQAMDTTRAIYNTLGLYFPYKHSLKSYIEQLCWILNDGMAISSAYMNTVEKSPDSYIGIYLTGGNWVARKNIIIDFNENGVVTHTFDSSIGSTEDAKKELEALIQNSYSRGDFSSVAGYLVVKPSNQAPLALTTDSFIQIFSDAAALQQSMLYQAHSMGMEPTQG